MSVAYSEPYQRSKKYFAKIFNAEKLLSIFEKRSTLDIWQGSEYTSGCWNLFFFSPIFNISKPQTLMQKKVRGDYASNVFFLANPGMQGLCLKYTEIELSFVPKTASKRFSKVSINTFTPRDFPSTFSYHRFCVPNWLCKSPKAFSHAEDMKKSAEGLQSTVSPPVGPGQSPGGRPTDETPGSSAYLGFENLLL